MVHLWQFLRCAGPIHDWWRDLAKVVRAAQGRSAQERLSGPGRHVLLGTEAGCWLRRRRPILLHFGLRDDSCHAVPLRPALPKMSRGSLLVALLLAVVLNVNARPGTVRTLRGELISGDIQFTNGL